MTLVEIRTDTGEVGIGGADVPVEVVRPILDGRPWRLASILVDQDPHDIYRLASEMRQATMGQGGIVVNAMAALDMALWDLLGRIEHQPVYRLLGGAVQDRVMTYASATAFDLTNGLVSPLPFKSTERLVSEAKARVAEGFRAVKFGWGNHFEREDEKRLAAIRAAIGPDVRLMIDFGVPDFFGPGVTPRYVGRIAAMLAEYDIYFFEEPLPPYDVDGFATLATIAAVRIATGEMLCHGYEFDALIDRRAVDVIQPDAYRIGITQTLRVARRAVDAGILCIPHSPWSALAIASHVHVLATVPNGVMMEYPSPSLYDDTVRHGEVIRLATGGLVEHPLRPVDGSLPLPSGPGLGIGSFNPTAIERIESLAAEGLER